MIKFLYYALLLLTCSLPAIAQQSVVTGIIKNGDGQAASFATVSIPALKTGTTANQQGTYVLSVKSGAYVVKTSGVG